VGWGVLRALCNSDQDDPGWFLKHSGEDLRMQYDMDKIRTHLRLGLRHLLNAQKDRDRAGILDVLEVAYARDCIAVALDECRSLGSEAIAKVRGSNGLVYMGREQKERTWAEAST
jgi:hypothetical protein